MKMKKKQEKQETKKERKMRYLNETAVQIEILKWLALFATVAVYDMNPYCKICLGIIFLTDLGATKYTFDDLALKILMITLILSASSECISNNRIISSFNYNWGSRV